jgi:hypothetical protein
MREEIKQEHFVAAEILIALRHLRESFLSTGQNERPKPQA